MGWASAAIELLMRGETAHVRPRGHSMTGRVNDGDKVTAMPFGTRDPDVGGVVLVRCRGHEYLHLVKARQGDRFLIGNNRGGLNGWVGRRAIFGVAHSNRAGARQVMREPYPRRRRRGFSRRKRASRVTDLIAWLDLHAGAVQGLTI